MSKGELAPTEGGQVDPATAFDLLSDETRVRIVTELREEREGLRFSTLCDRVGAEDTGRFNYHLGRLQGRLVRKEGERYVLTDSGRGFAEIARDTS